MADQQQPQGNVRQEFALGRLGMNMDSSVNQVEKGQLTYALNASVENFDSNSVNYQNEPGNEICLNFPEGYQLIGKHFISEQNKHVFFLVNDAEGKSEIGYMDNNDCQYHTYINADCLNFQINHPIHKAVHKIFNCTTEIYWTDGVNPRRYLNLDNIPYVTTYGATVCDITTTLVIDCNKIKVQPNFDIPLLEINKIITGGELKAGTYQFAIQYANAASGGYTSYYSVTNPTPISNPDLTTMDFNYTVGRSIQVDIKHLDLTGYFEYYNLAVIKTINNITSVELIGTYFIDSATKQITYTGQNQTQIRLTVDDIFEKYPYYDIADDLAAVQDVLVWKGLTTIDKMNLQPIANQINLQWQTWRIPPTKNYSDELLATNYRGYLRDEVYAFEIVFLLSNGKQTDGFHIPGRVADGNDLTLVYKSANDDYIGDGAPQEYWKIYNTGSVTGFSPGYSAVSTYEGPYQFGQMSYWQSTETYPCNDNVWGELSGQPIRHHKFPDALVSPIFESISPDYNTPVIRNNAILPIGMLMNVQQVEQLVHNSSELTQEQKDSIVGFKIVRGDRATNRSIIAKGIIRNVGKYTREGTDYFFPNYPYNDLRADPFLLTKNNAYNAQANTFKITTIGQVTVQYTDPYTGDLASAIYASGITTTFCSLSSPVADPSVNAVFVNITSQSYTLTTKSPTIGATTFAYTEPIYQNVVSIVVYYGSPQTVNSTTLPTRISGSSNFSILTNVNYQNTACYPTQLDAFSDQSSKYRMVFNSPETSFGQPYLGNVIKMENAMFGGGRSHFIKVKKHALYKLLTVGAQQSALDSSYTIANLTGTLNATAMFTAYQSYLQIYINGVTRKNYAYSFNSMASYDYIAPVPNGQSIKQRPLDLQQYLIPGVQSVSDTYDVNNYSRETSVYLRTDLTRDPLDFPNTIPALTSTNMSDNSRFTASSVNACTTPEELRNIKVVAYYASMKNIINGQWGQMYSYNTIDTGFERIFTAIPNQDRETFFGGDTFIGRFAFKTKLPFFIDNRVGAPNDSDIFYDELGNIAYPQYWYSARSILNNYTINGTVMRNMISYKAHYFDCPSDYVTPGITTTTTSTTLTAGVTSTVGTVSDTAIYDGKMYLFAYGIPSFYTESSINLDLRQAFNDREGDFYPHVSSGIPDNWLQETEVPIIQDNTYYYNVTYSKQNKENYFSHLPVDWTPSICYTEYPFRAIYSETQDSNPNTKVNSWLNYAPVSLFDFPQNYGGLTSLDGIQNRAILARFENKTLMYNNLLTINTSNPQAAYVGNPNMFSAPPIDFAETDLGYVGSQNKMLLKIPNGQITIDAKRGQVFLIQGTQAQDLSAFGSGMTRFFTDHLAFEVLRYFPDVNTDNHFNGIGLHSVYDSKFDRVIISKLDYIPQVGVTNIQYDSILQKFYILHTVGTLPNQSTYREYLELTDNRYFCNKSWTLSFSFNTKSWISFHSYIPNFYIAENNFFYSGLNGGCDLAAVALVEIPEPPTTTSTTTQGLDCTLSGTVVYSGPVFTTTSTTTNSELTTTTTTANTTAPPPPVPGYNSFVFGYTPSYSTGQIACANKVNPATTVYAYSSSAIVGNGSIIYSIIPGDPFYPVGILSIGGFYSDGVNYWLCTDGVLSGQTTCPTCNVPTVINLSGSFSSQQPAQDQYEYYADASVTICKTYTTDINFIVTVESTNAGIAQVPVTIFAGNTYNSGQLYIGSSDPVNVYGYCIASCDVPSVVFTGYSC